MRSSTGFSRIVEGLIGSSSWDGCGAGGWEDVCGGGGWEDGYGGGGWEDVCPALP